MKSLALIMAMLQVGCFAARIGPGPINEGEKLCDKNGGLLNLHSGPVVLLGVVEHLQDFSYVNCKDGAVFYISREEKKK